MFSPCSKLGLTLRNQFSRFAFDIHQSISHNYLVLNISALIFVFRGRNGVLFIFLHRDETICVEIHDVLFVFRRKAICLLRERLCEMLQHAVQPEESRQASSPSGSADFSRT